MVRHRSRKPEPIRGFVGSNPTLSACFHMKKIFGFEFIFFLLTQFFGILVAQNIFSKFPEEIIKISSEKFSYLNFFLSFSILVFLFLFILRFKKVKNIFSCVIFVLIIFLGVEIFLETWLPDLISLIITLFLLSFWLIPYFERKGADFPIWFHNLLLILAMAGLGGSVGFSFSPMTIIVLFLIFSFYDFVAVYLTHHMVKMAKDLIETGAVLGFVVPANPVDFKEKMKEVKIGEEGQGRFSLLGGGDVIFPLLLSVSFIPFGLVKSFVVMAFSCLGLCFSFWLFLELGKKPMPALPPIFLFSLLGFLIVQIL